MGSSPIKAVATVTPYQLFMLALCLGALAMFGADALFPLDESTRTILQYADNVVCVLFLADFGYNLLQAENRVRYLVTWGWIDLLSSIPALDAFRWGRTARIVRILRGLRAMKSARAIARFAMTRRAESAALSAVLVTLLLMVFSSVAILQVEAPAGGNIRTAEDAVWWSVSTMTTVGYGDRYPITSEGRLIAMCLMAAGVGVFGTLSGLIASWFLSPAAAETESDVDELKELILKLREDVASLKASATAATRGGPDRNGTAEE